MTHPNNNVPLNHPKQKKGKVIRIIRVVTHNFMNRSIDLMVNGENLHILGANETGKTNLANAITYIFDSKNYENRKDFEIKVLDEEGNVVHGLDHTVELHITVDGELVIIKKNYSETWKKKPGTKEKQFGSNNTEYFINGVSTTMTDFQAFINTIVPENLFRLLITPTGFNELHWTERRRMLLEGFGNVTDGEIITLNPALSVVPEILQGHTIEEMLVMIRKKYSLTQKEQKKHNLLLGEAKHKIPEELFEPQGETELKEKLHSVQEQITQTRQKLQQVLHNTSLEQLRTAKNRAQDQLDALNRKITQLTNQKKELDQQIIRLRNKWEVKNEETISYTEIVTCPLCDQSIPEGDRKATRENALRRFQQDKQEALTSISAQGKELNAIMATTAQELLHLKEEQEAFSQTYQKLENELATLMSAAAQEEDQLREKLTALDTKEAALRSTLCHSLAAEQATARVAELQALLKQLENDLKALESQMMALEEFNRLKMQLLQDRVNNHFSMARFRLFKQLVSGEVVECCDTLYKGVPYGSNLNHGHKIQVGMDIVNGLSRRYNISLPLLVDNRESVDQLPPTNAQVISLSVSQRDSVLRPEYDASIQPLQEFHAMFDDRSVRQEETLVNVPYDALTTASATAAVPLGPDF